MGPFLYVDHERRTPSMPVLLNHAWVGQCDCCAGWHILHATAWHYCANPSCPMEDQGYGTVKVLTDQALHDAILAAYAVGGPDAALVVIAAQAP